MKMTPTDKARAAERRAALKATGKTIEQVATECGLKPNTVRAYLRKPAMHYQRARRMAHALECPMDLLRR